MAVSPGQFVYIRSRAAWAGAEESGDRARYLPPVEHERRSWLSVDGSRDGLLREAAVRAGMDSSSRRTWPAGEGRRCPGPNGASGTT